MDNVVCNGQELRLLDCASNALAAHDCTHFQDAGVVCLPMISRKCTYSLFHNNYGCCVTMHQGIFIGNISAVNLLSVAILGLFTEGA